LAGTPTISIQSKHDGTLNQYDGHTSDKTEETTKKTSYSCHPCVFGQNHTLFDFFCIGKLLPAASDSGQWPTKAQRFGRATGRWRWLLVEGVSREATVQKRTKKP